MTEKTQDEIEAEKKAADDAAAALKNTEHMIPKTRFDEVNEARKKAEEALAAKDKADKEAEEKRLKEKEDFKTLAEQKEAELEALKKQSEADKTAAEAKAKKAEYEASVVTNASKLNFADPQDAVRLLGEVEDVEAGLKKLAEDKPYLLKEGNKSIKLKANKGLNTIIGEEDEAGRRKRLLG